jgi:hypothetical protein
MKGTSKIFLIFFMFFVAAFLWSSGTAQATLLTYELNFEFSGATAPEGSAPWITAIFDDDTGNPDSVQLTMSATNLVNVEFISEWLFNFNTDLEVSNLSLTYSSGQQPSEPPNKGMNAYKADGDGYFDIQFLFPTSGDRFTTGETSIYNLKYTSAISVHDFDFLSYSTAGNGPGPFYSAAHIQGIGEDDGSGWVAPVPEPDTMLLLGSGLIGLAGLGRRKLVKK